jgi:hypothetical protein
MIFVILSGTQSAAIAASVLREHAFTPDSKHAHEVLEIHSEEEVLSLLRQRPTLMKHGIIVFESQGRFTGKYLRIDGFEKRDIVLPCVAQKFTRRIALRAWRTGTSQNKAGMETALRRACGCTSHKKTAPCYKPIPRPHEMPW